MAKVIMNKELKQAKLFEPDPLQKLIRDEIRRVIEKTLGAELEEALQASSYERTEGRLGYRNGIKSRELGTSCGKVEIDAPRGLLFKKDGSGSTQTQEFQSQIIRRYERRAKQVDDAILGIYLSGCNTRRIKNALKPMLKGVPLSKSSISRLIASLRQGFEEWMSKSLADKKIVYVYADGFHVKVRSAGRVCKMPVLAVVAVLETGEKELLSLVMRGSESADAWKGVLQDLVDRDLRRPALVIADGGDGLLSAIATVWLGVKIQRCTFHKQRNLLEHAPKHAHEEVLEDYHRIVYAKTLEAARSAREYFLRKWTKRCAGVAKSLQEAGDDLLTFFQYPEAQWKSLRTTNVIERMNEEFRRRVKTQSSLPSEDAVQFVLFGLFASGQLSMRKIDGWEELREITARRKMEAAT